MEKIKEVFSKPIQEASISDTLNKHFTKAVLALANFGDKDSDNYNLYICRIPDSDLLYYRLKEIRNTVQGMEKDLKDIYEYTISSTPDSNHHSATMMIDDYNIPDDDYINKFFEKSENERNKNLVVITAGNINDNKRIIYNNITDSSSVNREIKEYKDDSDKFIGRMQNTVNAIRDDKDTEINMDEYNIFMKSCTTYQRGVIACASGATKMLIKARHLYVRALFKVIAAAKANVPNYMDLRY
jgi:predicted RNA-binding protein YlqC (UPF0109 family)